MKTQITYKKLDGSNGVALIPGDSTSVARAKLELGNRLDLPPAASDSEADLDARLRQGGIDPASVHNTQINE